MTGELNVTGDDALSLKFGLFNQEQVEFQEIQMNWFNETHYSVTIDYVPTETTEVLFRVQVSDNSGFLGDFQLEC